MIDIAATSQGRASAAALLQCADALREKIGGERFRDDLVAALYRRAEEIAALSIRRKKPRVWFADESIDRVLTHPVLGIPAMAALFGVVFWITVVGANVPSAFLAGMLMTDGGLAGPLKDYLGIDAPPWLASSVYQLLHGVFGAIGAPHWLTGFMVDGVYLGLAWVVSVMLPPMAIFFPLFTLLEDLGYLPRVAFNLDWLFKRAGAHGKQALTMMMGFGCNAAGVIACRVIDSPRERLIAILTNVFVPCNGRFPTLITVASLFVAGTVAKPNTVAASLIGTAAVVGVVVFGVVVTLIVSWILAHTFLRGEPSAFILELPPYRRPNLLEDAIYILDRSHRVRALPCHCCCRASGRNHMDTGERGVRRRLARLVYLQFSRSLRTIARPRWRDLACLHHRHSGERNRDADRTHALHEPRSNGGS